MKVAVTGAGGMLGRDVVDALRAAGSYDMLTLSRSEFDVVTCKNPLQDFPKVDAVINCAAYTRVDDAESDERAAYEVNLHGALKLAQVCRERGLRFIHFSTDYIFDGEKPRKYTERDIPNPVNVYGASKLAGEKAVRSEGGNFLVLRVQSLFGCQGRNFVEAIMKKALQGESLKVVSDQVSAPTYTRDVADAVLRLLPMSQTGVLHVASSGECSWYDFACAIVDELGVKVDVAPVSSTAFPRPARRPKHSVLDNHWYEVWTGQDFPLWEDALIRYMKEKRSSL